MVVIVPHAVDDLTKSMVRIIWVFSVKEVDTIVRNVVLVVNKAMSIVTEGERVDDRIESVRTTIHGVKKTVAEGHAGRKIFSMTKAVVKVSLVVVPDRSKAKVFLYRVRMIKVIWDKEVTGRVFRKVVSGVTKT